MLLEKRTAQFATDQHGSNSGPTLTHFKHTRYLAGECNYAFSVY